MSHLDRLRAPTNQYEPKSNATITIAGANPRVSECMLRRRNGQKGGATMTFVHTVLLYTRKYTDFQSSKQHSDGQHSKHRYGRMVSRVAQCGTLQHLYRLDKRIRRLCCETMYFAVGMDHTALQFWVSYVLIQQTTM